MSEKLHCEACAKSVVPVKRHWGWRVASYGALAYFAVLTIAVGASGTMIAGMGVVVFILGMLVVGPLHGMASEEPKCPECGRIVVRARERARGAGELAERRAPSLRPGAA